MDISDFDYHLPKELIAQKALAQRDHARLLIDGESIEHKKFYEIVDYLHAGDVLVVNDTKVSRMRLIGRKKTGSPAEVIVEGAKNGLYICRVKTKRPKIGSVFVFDGFTGQIVEKDDDHCYLTFSKQVNFEKKGVIPQPSYIKRKISEREYQTVYASKKGSLAAPTAGLHFTEALLHSIQKKGIKLAKVTLYIGFGTFLTVENLDTFKIHEEYFEVSARSAHLINTAKRVISVGTTSLRVLESAKYTYDKIMPTSGLSNVFIKPGYAFKSRTEMLITNFHLPKSTLLMLVCTFAGREKIIKAYKEAIAKKYRFYSLGDAMLLFRESMAPKDF